MTEQIAEPNRPPRDFRPLFVIVAVVLGIVVFIVLAVAFVLSETLSRESAPTVVATIPADISTAELLTSRAALEGELKTGDRPVEVIERELVEINELLVERGEPAR